MQISQPTFPKTIQPPIRPFPLRSPLITAIMTPDGHDADEFRSVVLDRFNMALGSGLAKFKGRLFRIGHMGACSDLMLAGAIGGVEMGLELAGIPHNKGGTNAAYEFLALGEQNEGEQDEGEQSEGETEEPQRRVG